MKTINVTALVVDLALLVLLLALHLLRAQRVPLELILLRPQRLLRLHQHPRQRALRVAVWCPAWWERWCQVQHSEVAQPSHTRQWMPQPTPFPAVVAVTKRILRSCHHRSVASRASTSWNASRLQTTTQRHVPNISMHFNPVSRRPSPSHNSSQIAHKSHCCANFEVSVSLWCLQGFYQLKFWYNYL